MFWVQFIHPFSLRVKAFLVRLSPAQMRRDKLRESFPSLVSCWEIFFDPLDKLHADFCHIVPSQSVLSKSHIHSHLDLNQMQNHFHFYAQTVCLFCTKSIDFVLYNHQFNIHLLTLPSPGLLWGPHTAGWSRPACCGYPAAPQSLPAGCSRGWGRIHLLLGSSWSHWGWLPGTS